MIAGLIPDDGNLAALECVIHHGLAVRLFVNNRMPSRADTIASYQELVVLGYSSTTLDGSLQRWTLEPGTPARATYRDEIEWTFAMYGPIVYGYYVTLGKRLLGVQRFADATGKLTPVEIKNRGDVIAVRPILEFGLPPATP